ncbi:HlyD family secretion protein [Dyella monticola]|uniref:HlyD family secretion protein n=1 Tax=Dyella monticola TaxID=1927958 RepID=UPI001314C960|nr:HlyD family secretion protein [Dyella monticola]
MLIIVLLIIALCIYIPRIFIVSTDDAYVEADTVTVVPKVPAYVTALHVSDNTAFLKGQLLVELDPRDYQVAVYNAAADLASARAFKLNLAAQIGEQHHQVAAAQAALDGDHATLTFANEQLIRYRALSQSGSDTKERLQLATSDVGQRRATVEHDTAALAAAKAHVTVLESQVVQADAAIAAKQAALDQARLNLSYTRIYATADGTVANRSVQVGNYVQPGQSLFSAVPREVFVIANVKETQLGRIRPGQAAVVRVDALPGVVFHGHVDSIQRGTGSNFALLPPENATGNFVKVVQRVPVKIVLNPARGIAALSPGMSVIARVVVHKPPFGQ